MGSQIILGVRNRQDQRGQQDRWGRLKLKTPLEWGPAGVGHGGGAAAHGMSCVLPQRSPQPTGPNTPGIAASKKTISERGADLHLLAARRSIATRPKGL